MSLKSVDYLENQKHQNNSIKSYICRICGDKASIINYGALSCQSCKTFFRRNASHPENVYPCVFRKPCEITIHTRRNCTSCRYAKCLSMGMNSNLIRKELQSKKRHLSTINSHLNQIVIDKHEKSGSPLLTLDLLKTDRSLLSNMEWTLLSNVIHAHDTYTNSSQISSSVEQLFISSSLPIFNTSSIISNVLELIAFMYTSIQSSIGASPDFKILTINEQNSLLERNLPGITALYSTVFFRTSRIIDNPQCVNSFALVYGPEMMHQAIRIDQKLDWDLTIVKLMLMILAFSSNCFITQKTETLQNDMFLHGTYRLLGSQNVYVELLWKYMMYTYGYDDSVRRFFRLIEIFLDLVKYSSLIYTNNNTHHDLVENVFKQTKQSLIIEQNKQEPLWGKT
ncbi:hypothetical protein I4U23_023646 [Adineta vaga]|nr:hypothetical protein I4U23_023646 [Adineta vaga]